VPGDFTREGGITAMTQLLEGKTRATCVFALNDAMALGALRVLRARGVSVPEQVSVAGFDDIPGAIDSQPALSTVRIPMAELGRMAIELAFGARSGELRVLTVPADVVLRESTAAVSA
jgi:LacI family transcriptional regulator